MPRENLVETYGESDVEDDEEKRTIFCANLDERVTEDLLYEVFLQAGPIESARIPKDHNGKQRSFGFITYVHKSTLPYAMHLYHGLSLYRKTVTIKYQGNSQSAPTKNNPSSSCNNKRSSYGHSSVRCANFSPPNDSPPQNPFRNNYSSNSTNSSKHQENILKHASSQRRPHINSSPYQRKSSGSGDRIRDQERDHNRRRHYNNSSNRHSEQRFVGKYRR